MHLNRPQNGLFLVGEMVPKTLQNCKLFSRRMTQSSGISKDEYSVIIVHTPRSLESIFPLCFSVWQQVPANKPAELVPGLLAVSKTPEEATILQQFWRH